MSRQHRFPRVTAVCVFILTVSSSGHIVAANEPPIAEAGLPRYAAKDPVQLDGSGSYDPDDSGPLSYAWTQVSGPPLTITGADTPIPTISGFVQTDAVQNCTFKLAVTDGELASLPSPVEVVIVPEFGTTTVGQENPPFDPIKPTVIYFGGGNCVTGSAATWSNWHDVANILNFPRGYGPDTKSSEAWHTYYNCGDAVIVYLSEVAPHYAQPIQTIGWSTGGQPALDVGIRLNRVYHDRRYAVNRVTELDSPCRWEVQSLNTYTAAVRLFLTSAVDNEMCWLDHYWGDRYRGGRLQAVPRDILGVCMEGYGHENVRDWYRDSLAMDLANHFNHGVVAGAYWSVAGPGKNLQMTQQEVGHYFRWTRDGGMVLFDETAYPGRFLEPVTLKVWAKMSEVSGSVDGAVLSCEAGENAVGYQLLFGSDPYRVTDYHVISDTSDPPDNVITTLPFEETWWTVRVRDARGSTIHADPRRITAFALALPVKNVGVGKMYAYLQDAIDEALDGNEVVVGQGLYQETIDFRGKSLTLRSVDPNDKHIVATTIVAGGSSRPVVTLSSGEGGKPPVLDGLTITGGTVGISCTDATPTIRNCTVGSNGPVAIEFWCGYRPRIVDCNLLGEVTEGGDPTLIAHWKLDETQGSIAYDSMGKNDAAVTGGPASWQPTGGKIGGALQLDGVDDSVTTWLVYNPSAGPFSVFVWVRGGVPGQAILSQADGANWLMAGAPDGALATDLKSAARQSKPLASTTVVTDGNWHRACLSWDGTNRILYVDDVEAAKDTQANLAGSTGNLNIGTDSKRTTGTFWSGLIDDARVYNRAVKP